MLILTIVLLIISVIIIIISFIMSPDSNAFSGALVGSGDLELFKTSKERGFKKILKYSMFAFGILLLLASVLIRIFL
ncbi:preprotein translocase subunit SecG [Mycoplasmopsis anatis]|uniref:preprotein translocase subunit SecG n=1 Tax=Mycoplasmatota TaxID=544448 RepID=UPI0011B1BA28|nr:MULTISPECIES: preprotein translocase subunit SecG [Mycoplasmatota]MBW0594825.1 preprotein translocase subunit SecG [Mycoplasmopsis anatis]MBW0595650.1 preprotein translocase subunit SecG [Mycoplasmopsis anatis]MBW0598470.1 preprotein translocase subunit SecG [Mycoplasmopsis anatis]MBW0599204.1 preprotein translocase subunit SecG [Mycoplasmopsis anatis]MBW0601401.1 preprotein translocase subunit SecG [Mycoplasmopsis anatis]